MNVPLRTRIRAAIRAVTGYDVHRAEITREPFSDIRRLIKSQRPTLFDVGANTGQTIEKLISLFPSSQIHAFEPSQRVFEQLLENWKGKTNVHLNNIALGSQIGRKRFFENTHSVLNSFLPLGPDGWGDIIATPEIQLTTLDCYCAERAISTIDLLKSDTQGFEMEVLRGAISMMRSTHLVYMEMNFAKLYEDMATFDELYGVMSCNNFALVGLYELNYKNDRLGWLEGLFINERLTH